MADEMRRGRSQVIWRYMPGSTFRYNDSGAWCRTVEITLRNPMPITSALARAVRQLLMRWNAIGPSGFPDPEVSGHKYAVGEPYQVGYTVWPTVFTCVDCGRVHYYADVNKLRSVNDKLGCRTCKGRDQLRQVPYGYVCECGRIDTLFAPKHEFTHAIELEDKGNFASSFWRCRDCGIPLYRNSREGLGFRSCVCYPKKAKRGIVLEDNRVYYCQSLALVDIEPAILDRWKDNPHFSTILLAASVRSIAYKPSDILDLATWKPRQSGLSPELRAVKEQLVQSGMTPEQASAIVEKSAQEAGADPWAAYQADAAELEELSGKHSWNESRKAIEYVFVRDEPSTSAISIGDLTHEAERIGDQESVVRLKSEQGLAENLGLGDLRIVQALPILLAGVGYSRYFSTPRDIGDSQEGSNAKPPTLRSFPQADGKIPVYVARNTTEALLFDLNPWRVSAFLEVNLGYTAPEAARRSSSHMRAWILGHTNQLLELGEAHLELRSYEKEAGLEVDAPSALVFGLVHSISHVLKATAHIYVGIDGDSLAEYLFPSHLAGLLYVSSHVQFTLGGIDSVFRSNLTQWLSSARDYANRCSFDPVCSQSGGACMACLYPKFGCAHFNRTVSRAFLFGGEVKGLTTELQGYWGSTVADKAEQLRSGVSEG